MRPRKNRTALKIILCLFLVLLVIWACSAIAFHFYPVSYLSYCIVPGLPRIMEQWILGEPDGYNSSSNSMPTYDLLDGYKLITRHKINGFFLQYIEAYDPYWETLNPFIVSYVGWTAVVKQ